MDGSLWSLPETGLADREGARRPRDPQTACAFLPARFAGGKKLDARPCSSLFDKIPHEISACSGQADTPPESQLSRSFPLLGLVRLHPPLLSITSICAPVSCCPPKLSGGRKALTRRRINSVESPQRPRRLVNVPLPIAPLEVRTEQLGNLVRHGRHAPLVWLAYGHVVDGEADERSRSGWVLAANKDVAGREGDEVHHDVEGGEVSKGGVEGRDGVGEGLLGGGRGEGPLGVVDEPERHVESLAGDVMGYLLGVLCLRFCAWDRIYIKVRRADIYIPRWLSKYLASQVDDVSPSCRTNTAPVVCGVDETLNSNHPQSPPAIGTSKDHCHAGA